jgi:hypothetical protein
MDSAHENVIPSVIRFGRELDLFLVKLSVKGYIASVLVAILAVILIFQDGISTRTTLLLSGALTSPLALFGYVTLIVNKAYAGSPIKGMGPMLLAAGGSIPYVFGCYLVFYEGLYGFVRLISNFTFGPLLASAFYLVTGYAIVVAIYRVTEFARALDEGRITVEKNVAVKF